MAAADWMPVHVAAQLLGTSTRTLQRRASLGEVPAWRADGARAWQVSRAFVEAALAARDEALGLAATAATSATAATRNR